MSSNNTGLISRLWFRWKSLRLPWRRRYLAGFDLMGNKYWEFKDQLNSRRMRRIVEYGKKVHLSDVKIAPHWQQWLRHAREDAPSIQEQESNLVRQARIKVLAAKADARWASQPSFLDSPAMRQPDPMAESSKQTFSKAPTHAQTSPFAKPQQGGPGEEWQPKAWVPPGSTRNK